MAKDKEEKYPYPSHFGSHASMIEDAGTEILNDPLKVVLKDEHGTYTTNKNRLDNGLADPNRYTPDRLEYLCPKTKGME